MCSTAFFPTQMNQQEYNSIDAMNFSGLKYFLKSPKHYLRWKNEGDEDKPEYRMGRAAHVLILEGFNVFETQFAVAPVCDRRTKQGKLDWESFMADNAGKDFLTADDFIMARNIADAFGQNTFFRSMSEPDDITVEQVMTGTINGVKFKGRLDLYNRKHKCIIDIKTTRETPTYNEVEYSMNKYRYTLQEVIYRELANQSGMEVESFWFGFCEKEEPNSLGFYGSSSERLIEESARLHNYCEQIKRCQDSGVYPDLSASYTPVVIG